MRIFFPNKRFLVVLALLLVACQVESPDIVPTSLTNEALETDLQTFEGLYAQTAEMSSFVPCEMDQFPGPGLGYWLVPSEDFSQLHTKENSNLMADIAGTYGPYDRFVMYVHFQGILSPPADLESDSGYGLEGLYAREVSVVKALEVKYYWIGTTADTELRNPCP